MTKKILAIAVIAVSLQGCATFSGSHPEKMSEVKKGILDDTPLINQEELENTFNDDNQDKNIGLLEKGRFDQLVGQTKKSQSQYSDIISVVQAESMEPVIRASKVAKNTEAILLSDKERNYEVPDYQITFLYAYQALNYLKQNSLSDAAVSIRNLSDAQDAKRYQEELDKQLKQENKGTLSEVFNMDSLNAYLASSGEFKSVDSLSKGIANAYANPMAYYLEAIIYEAFDNNYNNAFVSIQNAKDAAPDNKYIQDTYNSFKRASNGGSAYEKDSGRLTIIYEQGFVTPIDRCEIYIPATAAFFASAILKASIPGAKISLPCYKLKNNVNMPPVAVNVSMNNSIVNQDNTNILVDTTAMAAKSLQEAYPAILTREITRLATKTIATIAAATTAYQAAGDYGQIASLGATMAGSAYQYFTTVADQRSWLLLPNNAQLYVHDLPKGEYNIKVGNLTTKANIESYKNTLIWVTTAGQYNSIQYNNYL